MVRLSLALGGILYGLFGIADAWIVPTVTETAWLLRYGVVCPVIITVLVLSYRPSFQSIHQSALGTIIILASASIMTMMALAEPPGNHLYYAGFILLLIYSYFFLWVRWLISTAIALFIVILYQAEATLINPIPSTLLINNDFFLLSTLSITIVIGYLHERYHRHEFLKNRLLQEQEKRLHLLANALEQAGDTVWITDAQGHIQYVNPPFEQASGYPFEEALGASISKLFYSDLQEKDAYQRLWVSLQRGETFREVLIRRRPDGSLVYRDETITPIKDEQHTIQNYVGTSRDVTERLQMEGQLQRLAYYDVLTGLPNRSLFMQRLQQAVLQTQLAQPPLIAVGILELNRVDRVNESLGQAAGDQLLQTVAGRLQHLVSAGDTIAYLTKNRFALLLEEVTTTEGLSNLARQLLDAFTSPFPLGGDSRYEFLITAMMGLSVYPHDSRDPEALVNQAESALARAKEQGYHGHLFFTPVMNEQVQARLQLESYLNQALQQEAFVLHYQPLVNLASEEVVGVEVLIRWQHPERGLVSPTEFIPLLEETGLILPVGEWVLRTACKQIQAWTQQGLPPLKLSVNLSPSQFKDPALVDTVATVLNETGLSPRHLQFEITEDLFIDDIQEASQTLHHLREMGVTFAVDDFGTGYSALSYLQHLPLRTLKIDRSFISGIQSASSEAQLVQAIVNIASALEMETVAEGIEDRMEVDLLNGLGCHIGQGFYFGWPLPAETFVQRLEALNITKVENPPS